MHYQEEQLPLNNNCNLAIIGLGYVGLPLAIEFSKKRLCLLTGKELDRNVVGFDINEERLNELSRGIDRTNEVSSENLKKASSLRFTSNVKELIDIDVFIITVPTPIDSYKKPNLDPLIKATETVAIALSKRKKASMPVVIYESTVYPGVTEEICIPLIEEKSFLSINKGFFCGYSPERINPGDKSHRLTSIVKVTSGSNKTSAVWIDEFYGSIIQAGTYLAPSIKVAEAAKVIENTQRDINIALVNELSIIFNKLGIDTLDVLKAARTKWNFLDFKPGLVGGHCIGVDPYYLTFKAQELGYYPQVILAGRYINDHMAEWIVQQLIVRMARNKVQIGGTEVLILGFTFKDNCPDYRNTKVLDIVNGVINYGMKPIIVDPLIDSEDVKDYLELDISKDIIFEKKYSAVIVAVAHEQFKAIETSQWKSLIGKEGILIDIKGIVLLDLGLTSMT